MCGTRATGCTIVAPTGGVSLVLAPKRPRSAIRPQTTNPDSPRFFRVAHAIPFRAHPLDGRSPVTHSERVSPNCRRVRTGYQPHHREPEGTHRLAPGWARPQPLAAP